MPPSSNVSTASKMTPAMTPILGSDRSGEDLQSSDVIDKIMNDLCFFSGEICGHLSSPANIIQDMSKVFGGIKRALSMSTHSRSMSTYQMRDGSSYIIRAAGLQDYQSVIDLQQEWKMTPLLDKKTLCNGLIDRCRRGDYHCLVAVGNSQEEKLEEKLYGALVLQLGLNVPKELDEQPVEEKWQSDLKADAYVESLIVADWARRNGVGTNLMECAKRLAISRGMKQIFMRL